jgi:hypothetical protein
MLRKKEGGDGERGGVLNPHGKNISLSPSLSIIERKK